MSINPLLRPFPNTFWIVLWNEDCYIMTSVVYGGGEDAVVRRNVHGGAAGWPRSAFIVFDAPRRAAPERFHRGAASRTLRAPWSGRRDGPGAGRGHCRNAVIVAPPAQGVVARPDQSPEQGCTHSFPACMLIITIIIIIIILPISTIFILSNYYEYII